MDIEVIEKAKKLEAQINYSRLARTYAKEATSVFFKNDYGLGVYIGCLCKDKTFYQSLIKLLNDTEKRFQYKFDML